MTLGILGTGVVAKTLAGAFAARGHDVILGTRDPAAAAARTQPGAFGDAPLSTFLAQTPRVRLGTFAEAAAAGELVFNATSGDGTLAAVGAAAAALDGKILVDVANPLDFSRGFPPTLSVCNDDSLGERVQRAVPGAKVVKALNTVNANLMVAPRSLADGDHTLLVCGDDAGAKGAVTRLLVEELGWRDVVDLGGIAQARGTEMYLPLWVRLYGALRTPAFSIKLVR